MQPSIGPVNVKIFGGWGVDGEQHKMAKITTLGDRAKLFQWDGKRFNEYDCLAEAEYTENMDGTLTIIGVSSQMQEIIGLDPKDAHVRWEAEIVPCVGCDG